MRSRTTTARRDSREAISAVNYPLGSLIKKRGEKTSVWWLRPVSRSPLTSTPNLLSQSLASLCPLGHASLPAWSQGWMKANIKLGSKQFPNLFLFKGTLLLFIKTALNGRHLRGRHMINDFTITFHKMRAGWITHTWAYTFNTIHHLNILHKNTFYILYHSYALLYCTSAKLQHYTVTIFSLLALNISRSKGKQRGGFRIDQWGSPAPLTWREICPGILSRDRSF